MREYAEPIEKEIKETDKIFSEYSEDIESDNPGAGIDPKESKLKRGLDIFGCLFALNICFVISCIPIITIGAALTAMYAMMFRIQRHDDYTVVKEYFREMKANFKKSTIAWFIILLAVFIMFGQSIYVMNFEGGLVSFYRFFLVIEIILFAVDLPFVFPLLARFDNSVLNTFKNSFLLAVSNFGAWIKMTIAWVAPIAFGIGYEIVFLNTWYLWILLIFGLITYGTSLTAKRVFDNVEKRQDASKEDADKPLKAKKTSKKKDEPKKSIKERMKAIEVANKTLPKEDLKVDEKGDSNV